MRRIREVNGQTLAQVAEKTGMNKATISKIENGVINYTSANVEKIAHALGVRPIDVFLEANQTNVTTGPDINGTVPLISWVAAGSWCEAIDNLQPGDGDRISTTYRAKAHTYALRVKGDSMEPKFPDGAILIVEPDEDPAPGKFVIVRQNGDTEAVFKQLIQDGGTLYLKPLNDRYPILQLRPDAVFCGVVKRMEMDV